MRASGTFKIGYREDAAPFSFKDTLGEPAGFSVELCRLIAAQVKQTLGLDEITIEYVPVGTEDRFQAVQDGRIDILCSADTVTLSRRELVDFSLFTFLDGAAVLLRADSPEEFEGLAGQKIGVRGATTTEEALRNTLAKLDMKAEVVPVSSHDEGPRQAGGGRDRSVFRRSGDLDLPREAKARRPTSSSCRTSSSLSSRMRWRLPAATSEFRLLVDRTLAQHLSFGRGSTRCSPSAFGEKADPTPALRALYVINGLAE